MSKQKHAIRSLLNIASPKKLSISQIKGITGIDEIDARKTLRSLREAGKIKSLDFGADIGRLYWFNDELLQEHPARNLKPSRSVDVNH